ncbi:glycosyltransferase family 39 protein [Micromonospora sp. NPDC049523]|uniref:ArnT family glycosyltransferase n=1 Tax=Micromonospora sp. NPDC049523 TaxID=3155921 RepID=UPI00343F15B7
MQGLALAAICVLAGLLYAWLIGSSDYGNSYYSAAAKSMTESLSNFLFGAADPYGVVSVDKPPLALWPQAISVMIFGFHSWSLLLPQVVEGVLAVFLLHRAVRLWAGENVALLAALILALTPITVAINRDNNMDSLLVLVLVAAAYALTRSVYSPDGRGRTRWLLLTAFFVGCGFNAKMLQAWIIVPVFALAFLVSVAGPIKRRITDLLAAGGVLVVSSFWWPVLHDLWPGDKPYMGGSTNGSALELVFGYNGFGALFGYGQRPGGSGINVPLAMVGLSGGSPGISRMFSPEVGGQISWLLPLALLTLLVVGAAGYRRLWFEQRGDPAQRAGWFLWGGWLLITFAVFSFTEGIFNTYYTVMLAPAIAAVCAAGIAVLWRKYRDADGYGWLLLPLAVALTAVWAFRVVSRDLPWNGWSRWAVLATAAVAVAGLVLGGLSVGQRRALGRPALVLGVVSALIAPAAWSVGTASVAPTNGGFPAAGPPNEAFSALLRGEIPAVMRAVMTGVFPPGMEMPPGLMPPPGMPPPGAEPPAGMPPPMPTFKPEELPVGPQRGGGFGGTELFEENRKVVEYAQKNSAGAGITLAVEGGGLTSAPFIIHTDATVVGLGGYLGADNAPTVDQLQRWVDEGELKFVYTARPEGPQPGGIASMGGEVQRERLAWTERTCTVVDPAVYGGTPSVPIGKLPTPGFRDATLYRCG